MHSATTAKRSMVVNEAKLENGWLMLKTQPAEAFKWLMKFVPDKDYEIKRAYKKRSLDANAYFWVLLDRLAAELGVSKNELYQQRIKEIGGVSDTVCVPDKAVKRLVSIWEEKGLGWQTETFPSKLEGCTNVILYYGSQSVGIETKSAEEINSLLNQWNEKEKT